MPRTLNIVHGCFSGRGLNYAVKLQMKIKRKDSLLEINGKAIAKA